MSSFAEDLAKTRDERAKCLNLEWSGPIAYDPLSFFSIFGALYSSNFASYKLTIVPWLVVVVVLLQPLLTMHLGFLLAVDPNDVARWIRAHCTVDFDLCRR